MPAARVEQQIEAELVEHLVRQAPIGFVTGTFAVAAVVLVLWDAVPRTHLMAWVLVIALLSLPAFVLVWRFPRTAHAERWTRALIAVYGLAGAGWGAVALFLYPEVALPYQLFLVFLVGSAGVGGMAALAPVRAVVVAYLTATFLPMIAVLLAERSLSSVGLGFLLLIFAGATVGLAWKVRALIVRSVKLRFEKLGLIDDLSRAKDEAEAASRAKSVFLANVSHELRTPLALILGPTRRLLGAAGEDARRDLETVERNAQALLKHVTDLLDVAKLEAGRMELDRSDVDLVALVRRTVSLFEIVARERSVELSVETPDALWASVDGAKLERVLLNLLSNAIKFAEGRVRGRLLVEGGEIVLSVEDDGPGVPVPLRAEIFERFRKGDDSIGGTGLGLAIARELVERHGGRIAVGDGPDGGARFTVRLPLVRGESSGVAPVRDALDEIARQTVAELRPLRQRAVEIRGEGALVLVVEDNPEMGRYLSDCLAPEYRVATASDGREGLEKALALRPDVILTDVMMPVMGGDVLVRELRAHPELEGIPIIVLTAKADEDLRVALLHAGAQDFITKPIVAEELCARVSNFVMLKRTRDVLQRALSSQSRDLATMADELAAANRSEGRVPGGRVARAAGAALADPQLGVPAARRAARSAVDAARPRGDRAERQPADTDRRRPARRVAGDHGEAPPVRAAALARAGGAGGDRLGAVAGGGEGDRDRGKDRDRLRFGRCGAAAAGGVEPGLERDQVHAARRSRRGACRAGRRPGGAERPRRRDRDQAGCRLAAVRAVLAGGQLDHAGAGGAGARAGGSATPRRAARRNGASGERGTGTRGDVHGHATGRRCPGGERAGAGGARESAIPGPAGAGGG
jgi:signal transduction histidine kinase/FixJ family two-component response regulator